MCGIWDWQSTIVKDLNDSQDLKHTLFCREIVFVAIYALFSDNKCLLFTRLGGGVAQSGHCLLFYRFSYMMASLSPLFWLRFSKKDSTNKFLNMEHVLVDQMLIKDSCML